MKRPLHVQQPLVAIMQHVPEGMGKMGFWVWFCELYLRLALLTSLNRESDSVAHNLVEVRYDDAHRSDCIAAANGDPQVRR
jgi:hypothetical protein